MLDLDPQKCSNLKNEDFPGIDLQQLGWRRWRRSQRRCYKFRLVAGSTAPSNTFIANKSITIPPGTLDPSSRSPCRRLTHFCPTQIPKVPFFGGKQYFGSLRQPQVSDCHQSVPPKLLKPPLFAPQPINQNPPCPPPHLLQRQELQKIDRWERKGRCQKF